MKQLLLCLLSVALVSAAARAQVYPQTADGAGNQLNMGPGGLSLVSAPGTPLKLTAGGSLNGLQIAPNGSVTVLGSGSLPSGAASSFATAVTVPAGGTTFNPSSGNSLNLFTAITTSTQLSDGHDRIVIGPWISGADTFGISVQGGSGSQVQVDCNDVTCATPFSGVQISSPNALNLFQLSNNGLSATVPVNGGATVTCVAGFCQPMIIAASTFRARTTAIGTTTLVTNPGTVTASYRLSASVFCDTSVATATATLTVTYLDPSSTTQSVTGTGATCTTLGAASLQTVSLPLIRVKNAGTITWAVAIANAPNYDASVIVEQLTGN